jgi:transcription termination factor Rho
MSVEPKALERSVLEGKERDELTAIAEALGLKPAARATKTTLISQILKEAGVDTGEDDKPKRGRGRATANGEAPDDAAPSERQPAEGVPDSVDEPGADTPSERDEIHASVEVEDAEPAAETRTDERPRERRPREGGNRESGNRESGNREGGPRPAEGAAAGGGPELGNRRSRRRRGRDRERPDRPYEPADQPFQGEPVDVDGLLDLRDEGYGFLRTDGYLAGPRDVYVSLSQVRRFALRKGDYVKGASRPANSNEKYPALLRIDTVNGMTPDEARSRPRFETLTPLFPDEKLRLEVSDDSNNMTARIVDLISPIGKGQRGLIVSPPKAGKTTIMKQIARSIETNSPEVHLMVLLVDERPEEVTDMQRWVKGEVVASTFDRPSEEHTQVAELAIERAKRLVELQQDVVIILDGITRLARAYNLAAPASGRILSGGVDSAALYPPKKFFGAARNIEEGGSLTILATALVETGSRMDEVIFEEFKGTGNMELRLDRKLAERRIYPSIDVEASSTRHEELLFERVQLQQVWKLRRVLSALEGGAGLELLMDKIRTTKSNDEFLAEIAKAPTPGA